MSKFSASIFWIYTAYGSTTCDELKVSHASCCSGDVFRPCPNGCYSVEENLRCDLAYKFHEEQCCNHAYSKNVSCPGMCLQNSEKYNRMFLNKMVNITDAWGLNYKIWSVVGNYTFNGSHVTVEFPNGNDEVFNQPSGTSYYTGMEWSSAKVAASEWLDAWPPLPYVHLSKEETAALMPYRSQFNWITEAPSQAIEYIRSRNWIQTLERPLTRLQNYSHMSPEFHFGYPVFQHKMSEIAIMLTYDLTTIWKLHHITCDPLESDLYYDEVFHCWTCPSCYVMTVHNFSDPEVVSNPTKEDVASIFAI